MHNSAVFLRHVVVFSNNRVVSWEIFDIITYGILFYILIMDEKVLVLCEK